ncbi:hypothetical protein E4U60_005717 [Claviceps pazoutovae]|uniref:Uncharacterized protein n=1 Tax=Claviceps pazoutovae TaxID=1649127 RepID=A0A9P7M7G5_9HYPO|nr:hypothetical protein E4U60_005717 [Claviceps pazoutovae]
MSLAAHSTPSSSNGAGTVPPQHQRLSPKPDPLAPLDYVVPTRITNVQRTYSKRRKLEVLLFLLHHRIHDLESRVSDHYFDDGSRRPYIREASAWFKIPTRTINTWWKVRASFGITEDGSPVCIEELLCKSSTRKTTKKKRQTEGTTAPKRAQTASQEQDKGNIQARNKENLPLEATVTQQETGRNALNEIHATGHDSVMQGPSH